MTGARFCQCDHPEDYHRVAADGAWYCAGRECECAAFRPRPGMQGRML
jgi:hypothetical protein